MIMTCALGCICAGARQLHNKTRAQTEEHIKNHSIIVHEAPLTAVGNNILSSMDQTQAKIYQTFSATYKSYSNIMSFFRFASKRAIYQLGIISWAHAPVYVTDFPVVNVHVDELSSARMWQHKLCATLSANVKINYRLPIKVYYRICTLRHIRIEGSG
jgi:hypothetical protein